MASSTKTNGDYFKTMVTEAQGYVSQPLNFKGYNLLLKEYNDLQENDIESAWKLAKKFNSWTEYLSDLLNFIEKLYLEAEAEKVAIYSQKSLEYSPNKVSAGERQASMDKQVLEVRKKRNVLLAFRKMLEAKIKFFERAHYHCKSTYEQGKSIIGYAERVNQSKK